MGHNSRLGGTPGSIYSGSAVVQFDSAALAMTCNEPNAAGCDTGVAGETVEKADASQNHEHFLEVCRYADAPGTLCSSSLGSRRDGGSVTESRPVEERSASAARAARAKGPSNKPRS